VYFLAMLTTRRRLASTSLRFADPAFFSPASMISTIFRRSAAVSPVSPWIRFRDFRASFRRSSYSLSRTAEMRSSFVTFRSSCLLLRICAKVLSRDFRGRFVFMRMSRIAASAASTSER